MLAAEQGQKDIVCPPIDREANINASNNRGNTALLLATRYQHREMVRVLIALGADVEAANNDG
ncbi:hypothetical protein GGR58DRAFT_470608 [Xylaria digitata]|nr:hypothetical protein GGR58DRAFT_470608 [Xylaria digitata]